MFMLNWAALATKHMPWSVVRMIVHVHVYTCACRNVCLVRKKKARTDGQVMLHGWTGHVFSIMPVLVCQPVNWR